MWRAPPMKARERRDRSGVPKTCVAKAGIKTGIKTGMVIEQ
jgi:hypothetical protein